MNFNRRVTRQASCYTCVVEDEEPTMVNLNVLELAEKGDLALLESLVRRNAGVLSEKDECGAGPLHHAAAGGHVALIQFIISATDSQLLNSCDDLGNMPLHWAVERDEAASCRALMDVGADPNTLNKALMSPLHLAVSKGHNDLVELLLCYPDTDYNLPGDLGNTAMILACSINNFEALSILLKNGALLCKQNKLGHFPVHAAAFAGAKKSMEVVLKAGIKFGHQMEKHINYLDKNNSSPLHLAVRGGNLETIQLCISLGAKIDQKQSDKSTPLHLACTQGATDVVKHMLSTFDHVEDIVNLNDGAMQTPLHRATIFDHMELAEYLISLGASLDDMDCKGNTPLLVATNCGAWRTVALLLTSGADVSITDSFGCNFLHRAIMQPKGLKNLPQDVLQWSRVKALLNCEDGDGCTPLHYACRLGIHNSVRNMLGLSGEVGLSYKSRDKKSALHFAAQYGRINTCRKLLENLKDSRLLNEGDEKGLTPLHLAAREGHSKVVELLLRKGALFHCDYKEWTCLHHAASEGYTQTMEKILAANIKLMDKTDEDGNTALHVAAKEGHVAAVRLLMNRGAEFVLNKNDASFLHEAIQNANGDVVKDVIDNHRRDEAIHLFIPSSLQRCPILQMIEFLPETFKHLLDSCVKESDDPNCPNYKVEYNFRWLQPPLAAKKYIDKTVRFKPLAALNAMVTYNRVDLLTHPVCKKYLSMKWGAYGSKAHLLNMFIYLLGLLPLTYLIISLRPTMNITDTGTYNITMIPVSITQNSQIYVCMVMVLVMNIYSIAKEVVQIHQQRWNYFKDTSNPNDWMTSILCLVFIIPLLVQSNGTLHWQAGALAVLTSWIGFLLYLQRFEGVGIYVVMFGEIMKTLVRVVLIFIYLLFAFALAFYALMPNQNEFKTVPLSVMQTFVMMVGELNYQTNILDPYLKDKLPFSYMTYYLFVMFVLCMPILLINLMIGLAVGDIAEVQRNASLKRIAMQVELHTALEDKLPYWFMKRVDKLSITIYPNRKCSMRNELWKHRQAKSARCTYMENELRKQKSRMKEMSSLLEKQHSLLKLVIKKMEITSEADEYDGGPANIPALGWPSAQQIRPGSNRMSRWAPVLKALANKKK